MSGMPAILRFSPTVPEIKPNYYTLQLSLFNMPMDFANITAETISEAFERYSEVVAATYDYIAQTQTLSFATVVQPMINLDFATQGAVAMIKIAKDVHFSKEVRDVSTEFSEKLEAFVIEQQMRDDAYAKFKLYYDIVFQTEQHILTAEEKTYVEDKVREYGRSGMTLEDAAQRSELKQIQQRLAELTIKFQSNLNEDTTSFEFTREELNGLPDDWFTKDRFVRDGVYKVTLKYPDLYPIMEYCTTREVRRKMFNAFNTRCKDINTPIAIEMLQLRDRMATLLGFKSAADYATELKMTKNAANVAKFLTEMNQRFEPLLDKTLEALRDYAKKHTGDPNFELNLYDMAFYMKQREKALCQVDHKIIREYFPRAKVLQGTMAIYQELLGLEFSELATDNKWHADTQLYEVRDAVTKEIIGSFILDLAPREGKYAHACVGEIIYGGDASKFTGVANHRTSHLIMMLCNFPTDAPLSFDDVTTFFHEFGHVMHCVCSRVQLPDNNGFHVELDFVEAPSQMLENWCFDQRILNRISAHKDTGLPIPAEMVIKIREAELLHAGYFYKRQLGFSTFDYHVHAMNADQLATLDINAFYNQLCAEICKLPKLDIAVPASFHHIFGNEYYCGYYGYMYSEVVAFCMFYERFKEDPLNKEAGMRYRKCILEPGATKDAMDLVRVFLGHEPTLDAFLRHCGLTAEVSALVEVTAVSDTAVTSASGVSNSSVSSATPGVKRARATP
jgi:thimet oligopeptidase